MSIQQHGADATRHNIAMAAAGFIMAGAIIGAGIVGMAVGHELAPAPVAVPAAVAPAGVTSQATAAPLAITINGDPSKPGVYAFSPGAITVRAGQKVMLAISNSGAAMHGIAIPEFGVNTMVQPAAQGHPSNAQVSFTPTRAGTYLAHCIVYCGPGHAQMILRITVL